MRAQALLVLVGSTVIAHAEPNEHPTELAFAAYGRRIQDMNSGAAPDIDRNGDAFEAKVGYRLHPRVALGMYAELGGFEHDPAMIAMAQIAVGAYADLHLAPLDAIDPWFELGAGPGYERLRAQFGLDSRASERVSLAPVIGAAYANNAAEPEWLVSVGVLVRVKP